MYQIGCYEGFRLFEPAPEAVPAVRGQVEEQRRRNRQYLEACPAAPGLPMRITGSFICAHAPDYVGVPTLDWSENQWRELFAGMRGSGIDTVIWQASAWNELEEVYYRSECFSSFRQWNTVEPMLKAAAEEGMRVFLGGYGSVVGWSQSLDDAAVRREIRNQLACMRELLAWRDLFGGIYFSPETAFRGSRDFSCERRLNRLYRDYFSALKELAPEKDILMSPASKFHPGLENDFVECWLNLLDGVPLDILAPQDSIGCSGCSLADQPDMWECWRRVAEARNIRLWANIELFERRDFGGASPFDAASAERVAAQVRNVSPRVSKCVCWEYPYFAGNAPGGPELRRKIFMR